MEHGINERAAEVIGILSKPINEYKEWAEQSESREWDFSEFFSFPFIVDAEGKYISLSDITLRNAFLKSFFG